MKECIDCLVQNGYEPIDYVDDIHVLLRKHIDGNEFILLLIGPHDGNDYGYVLRGDFMATHDRWSNADYERFFRSKEDFLNNWNQFWIFDETGAGIEHGEDCVF